MLFPAQAISSSLSLLLLLSAAGPALAQIPSSWSSGFRPNSLRLEVTYNPNNIRITSAGSGKLFTTETSNLPTFRLSDDSGIAPASRYTILLLDADAPTKGGTGSKSYLHFLGTNYKILEAGDPSRELGPENGKAASVGYEGPKPTDVDHRYVWLLFSQKQGAQPKIQAGVGRAGFDLEGFEQESGLGKAVAGLYFQTAGKRVGRRDAGGEWLMRVGGQGEGVPVGRRDDMGRCRDGRCGRRRGLGRV